MTPTADAGPTFDGVQGDNMDECAAEEIDGHIVVEDEPQGCQGKEHDTEYDSLKIHDPDDDSVSLISSLFKDLLVYEMERFYDSITAQQLTGHSDSIFQCPFCVNYTHHGDHRFVRMLRHLDHHHSWERVRSAKRQITW